MATTAEISCSGDQSDGVNKSAPPSELHVIELTTNIQPAKNVSGIKMLGANGLDAEVVFDGSRDIETSGDSGYGMFVKSTGAQSSELDGVHGGNVLVTSDGGSISTEGSGAHGILAHSVHGEWKFFGFVIAAGDGGIVTLGNESDVMTLGDGANSIDARNFGGFLGSSSGPISVTSSGRITTSGKSALGIFGRSVALLRKSEFRPE